MKIQNKVTMIVQIISADQWESLKKLNLDSRFRIIPEAERVEVPKEVTLAQKRKEHIARAESFFKESKYQEAKAEYLSAMAIKNSKTIQSKIEEIDQFLTS